MKKVGFSLVIALFIWGCGSSKKTTSTATIQTQNQPESDLFPESAVADITSPPKSSATRTLDILHTRLEISFDWSKQRLNGKALLQAKPYFYPMKEAVLDAKNFDIKTISLTNASGPALKYSYDSLSITITLDKEYTRQDTFSLYIEYTARPNERKTEQGQAITSDKGLYFINPEGKEKNKPTQVWSQGEPESNSCWFPTVDKPNERMTHEIFITVDSAHSNYTTLSNGLLISSKKNNDNSRTDHWKHSKPSAPYLVMIAAGDFRAVKDKWRNMEVNYYMEPEFEQYAKDIYGNTPEMIEFFSKRTGVDYPWDKYAQIAVRDYVSGAMENTTAVIFGEFMNQTPREMLDQDFEDVISHELFHHWFGDLVTCENWTDLTLNEGFATYGEYLWREHKYGRENADEHLLESVSGYLATGLKDPKHLIRFHYNRPDEMFDENSYNKGGAVLHMLRKYLGDEAFFTALNLYLERNKFTPVEAHQLRLTFEEVSGEDLNWFFNQWYYSMGYPELQIRHNYSDSLKTYFVHVKQMQDLNKFQVFKIPFDLDIYSNGKKERRRIWVNTADQEIILPMVQKPDMVNVDAEKALVCTKDEYKPKEDWAYQYRHAPLFLDRLEALKNCARFTSDPEMGNIVYEALTDKSAEIREKAIALADKLQESLASRKDSVSVASNVTNDKLRARIEDLAQNDKKSMVRARALRFLNAQYEDRDYSDLYLKLIKDSSYFVASSALNAYAKKNKDRAMEEAAQFEKSKSKFLQLAVAAVYSQYGDDRQQPFFEGLAGSLTGWEYLTFLNYYGAFLKRVNDETIGKGLTLLHDISENAGNRWIQNSVIKTYKTTRKIYEDRETALDHKLQSVPAGPEGDVERKRLNDDLAVARARMEEIDRLIQEAQTPSTKN